MDELIQALKEQTQAINRLAASNEAMVDIIAQDHNDTSDNIPAEL